MAGYKKSRQGGWMNREKGKIH